eukprot:gene24240-9839_t
MHPAFVAHLNIHDTAQTSDDPPELVSIDDSESEPDPATPQHSNRATSPVMSLKEALIRSWILDTGATASVTSDPTLLSHVHDLPHPVEIRMASTEGEPITCFKKDPQAEEPVLLSQSDSSVPSQSDSPKTTLDQLRAQLRTVYDGYNGPPDGTCWPEGLLDPAD